MAEWRNPVYDRTIDDVQSADRTSAIYQKGSLNADDLNRIEENFAYLEECLREDAIFIPHCFRSYKENGITYTDWNEYNLPWLSEINRIRANYNALVRLFLVGLGLPILLESNYLDYTEVNNWERIAEIGKTMFENMEQEYRRCGAYVCGGDGVDWCPYEDTLNEDTSLGKGILGKMKIG